MRSLASIAANRPGLGPPPGVDDRGPGQPEEHVTILRRPCDRRPRDCAARLAASTGDSPATPRSWVTRKEEVIVSQEPGSTGAPIRSWLLPPTEL